MYLTTLNIFLIYIFIAWLFFALPNRCRLLVILSASLLFYFLFSPIYIFVLLFIVVTTYVFGRLLAGEGVKNRKYFFIASI